MQRLLRLALLLAAMPLPARDYAPVFRHDNQHTGRYTVTGPDMAEQLWSFSSGSSIPGSVVTGKDGTLYVSSADHRLYALMSNGGLAWKFEARESIYGTPAVGPDGAVVFADLSGMIYSLRPDGVVQWSVELGSGGDHRVVASPTVAADGTIYICSWDDRLYAYSRAGALLWQTALAGLPSSSPALDNEGNIYIVCRDLVSARNILVQKIDPATRRQIWRFSEDLGSSNERIISTPALDLVRNRLYVGACRANDGVLYSLNLSTGSLVSRVPFSSGIVSSPAVAADGSVIIASITGQLSSIDPASGAIQWSFSTGGAYFLGSPVIDATGRIFIGDSDGTVYSISPAGQKLWSYGGLDSSVNSSPAVGEFGRLYVTSSDGRMVALGDPTRSNVFFFPQLADGVAGDSRYQTSLMFINTGCDSEISVEFFDPGGGPMPLAFDAGIPPAASITRALKHGEALALRSLGVEALRVGYARVTTGPGVGGTAVYGYSEKGLDLFEAGVPAVGGIRDFSLAVEATASGRYIGVALVNTGSSPAAVVFRLYDSQQNLVRTLEKPFAPGYHIACYAHELFPEILQWQGTSGVMTVQSAEPLAVVTLRHSDSPGVSFPADVPTLSPFPVVEGRADAEPAVSAGRTFFFPHFATGRAGGSAYRTTLILVNSGRESGVSLDFYDRDGQPAAVALPGRGAVSSLQLNLKQGEGAYLETDGTGPLQVGSIRVTGSADLGGTEVFSYSEGEGPVLSEAGVPASQVLYGFAVYADCSSAARHTGLAVVNPGLSTAHLAIHLKDLQGSDVAETTRSLAPGAQMSCFATELFPLLNQRVPTEAVLWVESDQPVSAIALRQRKQPDKAFPLDVHSSTVFPIVPAGP